jgi:hypothetical protein
MNAHRPEVADVFRSYGSKYQEVYGTSAQQRRILRDLVACRTRALGGHKRKCDRCGHEEIAYNSCRNRHCPKCRAKARAEWLAARQKDLLPVPYFHVVFTLPEEIGPLALQNKRRVYGILFRAVSETLLTIARDPKHLGADIGFLAVLHTWGQNLHHHPHVHCVVPGGGLSPDGTHWIACRPNFFLPVRVLSRLFRKRFLALLRQAFESGELALHGKIQHLAQAEDRCQLLQALATRDWVVYAKPPFGGPEQVLKYLARYTHRVAISNQRILSFENGRVTFRWKDYAQANRQRTMTLDAVEFIRRFLLHALPKGFQRIRHFGFLANRVRQEKLSLCRQLLGQAEEPEAGVRDPASEDGPGPAPEPADDTCPACKIGRMQVVETIDARSTEDLVYAHTPTVDTS